MTSKGRDELLDNIRTELSSELAGLQEGDAAFAYAFDTLISYITMMEEVLYESPVEVRILVCVPGRGPATLVEGGATGIHEQLRCRSSIPSAVECARSDGTWGRCPDGVEDDH